MYGVPKNLNLEAFINEQIQIAHLGVHMFKLIFKDTLEITCEGQVEVTRDGVSTIIRSEKWENLIPLTYIQHIPVIAYNIDSTKSFSLTLKDSTKITFTDNSEAYESFQIYIGKECWVI